MDPKNYHVQLSVPRVLNNTTQTELLRVLFEKYGVKSVNLTHQSILALYAYNATSGIVVDIGERMDIVPVIDGKLFFYSLIIQLNTDSIIFPFHK